MEFYIYITHHLRRFRERNCLREFIAPLCGEFVLKQVIKRVTNDLRRFHGVADSAIGECSKHDVSDYSHRETSSEGTGAETCIGVSFYKLIKDGMSSSIPQSVSSVCTRVDELGY